MWQASVAGDDVRANVNIAALQPFVFYQLGEGRYLRSAAVSTYDFETDSYAVLLGSGPGRVFRADRAVMNAFVEPQYIIASGRQGQPELGIFAGVNFQF